MFTELFYLYILKRPEVSFKQDVSGVYTSLFLDKLTENGFLRRKSFRRFKETGPTASPYVRVLPDASQ